MKIIGLFFFKNFSPLFKTSISYPSTSNFIKLDVDGYEIDVLKSGEKFLKKNKPIIFMEIAPYLYPEFGYSCYSLISLLKGMNYNFFDENLVEIVDIYKQVETIKDGSSKNFYLF